MPTHVNLFGIPLGNISNGYQILFLTAFVFVFEIGYGFAQELLFSVHKFPYEWFSTFVQFIVYTMLSFFHHKLSPSSDPSNRKILYLGYIAIALASLLSRGLGNASFKHVDYGLKVLFGSAKPVLVMIAGIFLLGKRYSWREYFSTTLMVVGLSGFSIADAQVTGLFDSLGLILMFGSLLTDGLKSAFQEAVMRDYDCSEVEVVIVPRINTFLQ